MNRVIPLSLSLALLLGGCGGFQLRPVAPATMPGSVWAAMPISALEVRIDPAMNLDQQHVLGRYRVAEEMERVLGLSVGVGQPGGATVQVVLTSIRHSNFGPSRMQSRTTVTGPDGQVLNVFEAESISMRSKALKLVAQDHVQKIADAI